MADEEEKSLRQQQIEARQARIRATIPQIPRVRVTAASPELAQVLRHPSARKFPDDGGSVEWPLDAFTKRRLADGSIKAESEEDAAKRQRGEHRSRRHETPAA